MNAPIYYVEDYVEDQVEKKNKDKLLDPNHNHFIFVDDGSENEFGKEIKVRTTLESVLRHLLDGNSCQVQEIPMVCENSISIVL